MQKKFVSSLLLLLLLNVLVKPLWIFGIDLTVQNRVGAEAYGLYAAIFSFTMIFNIVLDLLKTKQPIMGGLQNIEFGESIVSAVLKKSKLNKFDSRVSSDLAFGQ